MIKKIGIVLVVLFMVEFIGCSWFWNQKPVCDENSSDYHDCMNPPPLPPMVAGPEAGTTATQSVEETSSSELLVCEVGVARDAASDRD